MSKISSVNQKQIRNSKGAIWTWLLLIFLIMLLGTVGLIGMGMGLRTMTLSKVQHAANEAAIAYARALMKLEDNRLSKTSSASLGAIGASVKENGEEASLSSVDKKTLEALDFAFAGLQDPKNPGASSKIVGSKANVIGNLDDLEYTEASQVLLQNLWSEKIPNAELVDDISQSQCHVPYSQSQFARNPNAQTNGQTCTQTGKIISPLMFLKWKFEASQDGQGVCCKKAVKCGETNAQDFCVVVTVIGRIDPKLEGGLAFLQNLGMIKDGSFTVQARATVDKMEAGAIEDADRGVELSKPEPQNCEFSCSGDPIAEIKDATLFNQMGSCDPKTQNCIRTTPRCADNKFAGEVIYLAWHPELNKVKQGSKTACDSSCTNDPSTYDVLEGSDSSQTIYASGEDHYEKKGKELGFYISNFTSECNELNWECPESSSCTKDTDCQPSAKWIAKNGHPSVLGKCVSGKCDCGNTCSGITCNSNDDCKLADGTSCGACDTTTHQCVPITCSTVNCNSDADCNLADGISCGTCDTTTHECKKDCPSIQCKSTKDCVAAGGSGCSCFIKPGESEGMCSKEPCSTNSCTDDSTCTGTSSFVGLIEACKCHKINPLTGGGMCMPCPDKVCTTHSDCAAAGNATSCTCSELKNKQKKCVTCPAISCTSSDACVDAGGINCTCDSSTNTCITACPSITCNSTADCLNAGGTGCVCDPNDKTCKKPCPPFECTADTDCNSANGCKCIKSSGQTTGQCGISQCPTGIPCTDPSCPPGICSCTPDGQCVPPPCDPNILCTDPSCPKDKCTCDLNGKCTTKKDPCDPNISCKGTNCPKDKCTCDLNGKCTAKCPSNIPCTDPKCLPDICGCDPNGKCTIIDTCNLACKLNADCGGGLDPQLLRDPSSLSGCPFCEITTNTTGTPPESKCVPSGCGDPCASNIECKSSGCSNCVNGQCSQSKCGEPCSTNSDCDSAFNVSINVNGTSKTFPAGCTECADTPNGRICTAGNCVWDINNIVPESFLRGANTGHMNECTVRPDGVFDNNPCSLEGETCLYPFAEPQVEGGTQVELPDGTMVDPAQGAMGERLIKLFRCACSYPNSGATWDFNNFAWDTENKFEPCPDMASCPGNKIDNCPCDINKAIKKCKSKVVFLLGRKIFKCDLPSTPSGGTECRWDLNNFTTDSFRGEMKACPTAVVTSGPLAGLAQTDNTACSLEGNICYKADANGAPVYEVMTLGDLLQSPKNHKVFKCNCSPNPEIIKPDCSWDLNNMVPTDDPSKRCAVSGSAEGAKCDTSGDTCYRSEGNDGAGKIMPTDGTCNGGFCTNYSGKLCIDSNDCSGVFPYLDPSAQDNVELVKLFRCACGNDYPSWDYSGAITTEDNNLDDCPNPATLPGQKIDNSDCSGKIGQKCKSTGMGKVFKCEPAQSACRLDLNNFTPVDAPLPICPVGSAGAMNNTDCKPMGDGWRCKAPYNPDSPGSTYSVTLAELKAGWFNLYRCDCNETASLPPDYLK